MDLRRGLCISILGLIPSIASALDRGSPTPGLFAFACFVALFAWAVVSLLLWPSWLKPRIVPYFTRELAEYGGETSTAFARGRGL